MVWKLFNRKKAPTFDENLKAARAAGGGQTPPVEDTRAAIEELSSVVKNDPEAVEIYLALGSLYRSQGEIERAIQIRNSLIVRPGLEREFQARAWFELGRDFRRAGLLDRAEKAFTEARSLGYGHTAIHQEMARLSAERGSYEKAAESYGQLNLPLPQAHYLVRLAQDRFEEGNNSQAHRALRHAIRAYPGSVEAWLEQIVQAYKVGNHGKIADIIRQALEHVEPDLRFVLFEGLLHTVIKAEKIKERAFGDDTEWSAYVRTRTSPKASSRLSKRRSRTSCNFITVLYFCCEWANRKMRDPCLRRPLSCSPTFGLPVWSFSSCLKATRH